MPITWMIISGSYLIPFDQVNQEYLENARSIGKSRIEVNYIAALFKMLNYEILTQLNTISLEILIFQIVVL